MSISVTTLVRYLRNRLDSDDRLHNIQVTGELSNFHKHSSGHLYFTLKDETSAINCVMFSSRAINIKFNPKNGDKVDISGNVSLFETTGQLQLYVNSLKLAGLGDLYQQYEILKTKLYEEGYFDDNHKKSIPSLYPEKIAVLVGENSAAMSDIKTCFIRRWPLANVDYHPVLVQGKDAPDDIINNLIKVDKMGYEIIVLARGGGSFEDLFCFNDENLVKTIYSLDTFIITGIGHEQDYTLSDFVADLRAPTPTASVELITRDIKDVDYEVIDYQDSLNTSINQIIDSYKMKIDYYSTKIENYANKFELITKTIDNMMTKIRSTLKYKLSNKNNLIENYQRILNSSIENRLNANINKLKSLNNLLNAYSIDNTLKRGYSLIYKDKKLIKNKDRIKVEDNLDIKLYDGNIKATVKEI